MREHLVTFTVIGRPATKGSARGFRAGKRIIITNDCTREKPWAQAVHWAARDAAPEGTPWQGPIRVELVFHLPRPQRLGKRRTGVRGDKKPDWDKLSRSVCDALTGVFFIDDAQISDATVSKRYADFGAPARLDVRVTSLDQTTETGGIPCPDSMKST